MPKKIGKRYVERHAKKLGCSIEEIGGDIILTAPAGYLLRDGTHYSGWGLSEYPKSEIWDDFADQMTRLEPCGCGCGDDK
jgi:hypothetical protein